MAMCGGRFEAGRDMQVVRGGAEGWVAGSIPGTMFKALDGSRTYLLKMDAGVTLPHHDHDHAAEQCLVIEGSAVAAGVEIHAGDYVRMPRGSHHEDFYSKNGCVLLISYR
jgi:anti-sigma factor ChrR (cupin superfamily)